MKRLLCEDERNRKCGKLNIRVWEMKKLISAERAKAPEVALGG